MPRFKWRLVHSLRPNPFDIAGRRSSAYTGAMFDRLFVASVLATAWGLLRLLAAWIVVGAVLVVLLAILVWAVRLLVG